MNAFTRFAEIQRTFVAPRGLLQSRPRAVELTATGLALVTVAIVLFAGAIVAGIALYGEATRQAESRRALMVGGVMTDGQVTRLWNDGDNRRRVEYGFAVDGRSYSGRVTVSAQRRRQLATGSAVRVRYVPANPRLNDLGGVVRGGMPIALPFIVSPLIAALGGLCLLIISGQRQLLTEGRAAPAVVTAHRVHQSSHGGKHASIVYEFPLLSGAVASGKSSTSAKPPAVGSVICVLYDPDRPKRNALYPLSLVRPAS